MTVKERYEEAVRFTRRNPAALAAVHMEVMRRLNRAVTKYQVGQWLNPDPHYRIEPLLWTGLALLDAVDAVRLKEMKAA